MHIIQNSSILWVHIIKNTFNMDAHHFGGRVDRWGPDDRDLHQLWADYAPGHRYEADLLPGHQVSRAPGSLDRAPWREPGGLWSPAREPREHAQPPRRTPLRHP